MGSGIVLYVSGSLRRRSVRYWGSHVLETEVSVTVPTSMVPRVHLGKTVWDCQGLPGVT